MKQADITRQELVDMTKPSKTVAILQGYSRVVEQQKKVLTKKNPKTADLYTYYQRYTDLDQLIQL